MTEAIKHLWKLSEDEMLQEYMEAVDKKKRDARAERNFLMGEAFEKGEKKGEKRGERRGIEKGRKEGEKKGREEGEKKGREKGRVEGREEGEKKGERKREREIAQRLLGLGMDTLSISQATGLSQEEIRKFDKKDKKKNRPDR